MSTIPIILTVWYCVATQPQCAIADDPTGPPVKVEFDNRASCEVYFHNGEATIPTPPGLITRHTCEPPGLDL